MAKHRIVILDQTGDTLVAEYDPAVKTEVDEARKAFDKVMATPGRVPVKEDKTAGDEFIKKFDPTAESIVFVSQIQGG